MYFLFIFLISKILIKMKFYNLDYSLLLEFEVLSINSYGILMTILLDWKSLLFMSFVLFISSMVIFYSEEYMSDDLNINRFIN